MRRNILSASIIATALALPLISYAQWTSAPASPPSSNVSAPINVGSSNQSKAGGLDVASFTSQGGALIGVTSGSLGIGVASANHKLDVGGNIGLSASGYLNFGSSDGSSGYGIRDSAGTLQFKNSGGSWAALGGGSGGVSGSGTINKLPKWTSSTGLGDSLITDNGTNVGINNASPTGAALSFANSIGDKAYLYNGGGADTYGLGINSGELNIFAGTGGNINFRTGGSAGTSKVYIATNGNVGIGGTPISLLSLNGSLGNKLDLWQDGTNRYGFGIQSGLLQMYTAGGAIAFGSGNSTSFTEYMRIANGGNVGIGVAPGSYKLDVGGDIRAQGAYVRTTGNTGLYNETWNGGWYMSDASWMRSYADKNVYTGGTMLAGTLSGTNLTVSSVTGTQCLHAVNGVVSGTGSDCGVGGGPGSITINNGSNITGGGTGSSFTLGVNNNPTFGNVTATGFFYGSSDRRLKKDIVSLDGASSLAKIEDLQGVSFKWKSNDAAAVGLIAQDVEKIYPELVSTDPNTGMKAVAYPNLIAPLIEAVKEQQKEINLLKAEVEALKNK